MKDFDYVRAANVEEAISALGTPGTMLLAGGQSLVPAIRARRIIPATIVDMGGIDDLKQIVRAGGRFVIGSGVTYRSLTECRELRETLPGLVAAVENIADPAVRNRATLGGAIAENHHASDCLALLLALNAEVSTNSRHLPVEELLSRGNLTCLAADEIITAISIPIIPNLSYERQRDPASRFALVGVAIAWHGKDPRVAVTGAAEQGAFRWSEAEASLSRDPDRAENLNRLPIDRQAIVSDHRASAEYRKQLLIILARRAVINGAKACGCNPA